MYSIITLLICIVSAFFGREISVSCLLARIYNIAILFVAKLAVCASIFDVGFISNARIICCYLGDNSSRNYPSTMNQQGLLNKGASVRLLSLKHSSILRLFSYSSKPDNS